LLFFFEKIKREKAQEAKEREKKEGKIGIGKGEKEYPRNLYLAREGSFFFFFFIV
jgi:hypothetical protein